MAKRIKKLNFKLARPAVGILLLAGLFCYLNSSVPFMAIASNSMSPALSRGHLILISSIVPNQIREGDIIVYRVLETFQEKYGYPATVCHRVFRIQNSDGQLSFRTKGDNAGQDPFMVLPEQVIGRESRAIPFLGYLVMFFQSRQGWYFLIGLAIIYLVYKNSASLVRGASKTRSVLFGVSTTEYVKSQRELEQKMSFITGQVTQSMDAFSAAMSDYAKHLASHTGAIESLAQAAKHLEMMAYAQMVTYAQEERLAKDKKVAKTMPDANKKAANPDGPEMTTELKAMVASFVERYKNTRDNETPG